MIRRKILINGGGIAGLTAALCLAKAGNRVEVFERAEVLEPLGAGIQISPNAFHVFSLLGLSSELLSAGDIPDAIVMMNAHKGSKLATIPLGFKVQDKYDAPYIVIHRADLQNILLKACEANPDISISFATEIVDAAIHKNGITALVKTNEKVKEIKGDLLVGADGIRSHVRNFILELDPAVYSGKTAWRALIPAEQIRSSDALKNTVAWLGSKSHAVTYPVRNASLINVIAVTQEPEHSRLDENSKAKLIAKFSHWNDDFKELLKANVEWSGWPLYETRSIVTMAYQTVALIGDAAHAMLPFAAQGAAQAIEDAHVLGQCLSQYENAELGLKEFERQRLSRVKRVSQTARTNGTIYHASGLIAAVRNFGLKRIPGDRLLQKQDWIYRWKP